MKKPQKKVAKKAPAKKAAPVKSKAQAKKTVPVKNKVKPSSKGKPVKKVAPLKAKPAKKILASKAKVKPSQKVDPKKLKAKVGQSSFLNKKTVPLKKDDKKGKKDPKVEAKLLKEKQKAEAKLQKEKAKQEKTNAKEAAKLQKIKEKELKKAEKEALKNKKKGGGDSFEDEILAQMKKLSDDEEGEEEDFEKPTKTKMVFDEDLDLDLEIPVRKKKAGIDEDIKENLAEEILSLSEDFKIEDIFSSLRNMDLFKIETDECTVRGCDNPATTGGYCRFHYIKFWKDIKKKDAILSEGRLAKVIEDLIRKYPVKYVESLISDLADDKAFNLVLKDLDIETDEAELDTFEDDELLDDDQDIAFETKVVKPSFDE